MNRLLIFSNDAASANVTMAYAYIYKDNYTKIIAYPKNTIADSIYTQHIIEYISKEHCHFKETDTIILGTSGIDASYEMNILVSAKKSNVHKIIVIVDSISNFNMRFTINNNIIEKQYLPNEIWVFENNFKSDINFINEKIVYTDNIYNIFLKKLYKNNPPKVTHNFINNYSNNYIVILTEYIYELYGLEFGFTEYDLVENTLTEISLLNIDIPIFLKLHPRENKNKFNIYLRKYNHLNIIQDDCNIQELIYYSKMVFGISSSVFMECKLFNIPSYSVQINSTKPIAQNNIIKSKEQLNIILGDSFIR